MKKIFTLILFAGLISFEAKAQDGISEIFKGSQSDVAKLTNAYANPLFKGLGNSLNGGWTNTAKTLGLFHFVVRLSFSGSLVPNGDKSFDAAKLGLSSNITTTPGQSISPTFGADNNTTGAPISIRDPATGRSYQTNLPSGELQIIPAPLLQVTVGLVQNTDVTLRLIPTVKVSDDVGSVGMFGFGIKHDIAQDFGTASHLIPFDLAIAFGYTRLNYNLPLDVEPQSSTNTVNGSKDFSNQNLNGHFTGINVQAIISKKLLFFTPFLSVGFASSHTNLATSGNYPFLTGADASGDPSYTSYANPINIDQKGTNGIRSDVGFQLSLAILKIYASYSFAEYQSANVGIGLGF